MSVPWNRYPVLLKRTFAAAIFQNNCHTFAKGAAYSALLALFPVLGTGATVLAQTHAGFVARTISGFIFDVIPPGTESVVQYALVDRGNRPATLLVVAVLLAMLAASGVVGSLMQGFQAAYRITARRSYLHHMAVSMLLVLAAIGPLLGASILILSGGIIDRALMRWLTGDPMLESVAGYWRIFWRLARYGISLITTACVTAILYYFGPLRKQRWADVWPGAFLATGLWVLATAGFAWYLRTVGNYNVLYGSVGTVIALLVWMYLTASLAVIGCQFNAVRELEAGS